MTELPTRAHALVLSAFLFFAGVNIPGSALAQRHQDAINALGQCMTDSAGNVTKLEACRSPELAPENAKLRAAYNKLYATLTPYQRSLLKKSERAWEAFRDSECELQRSRVAAGPLRLGEIASDQVFALNDCLLEQTRSRTKQLRDDYAAIKAAAEGR
jgi:uncharacterized protein YecT (DUF1311 family)